MIYVKGNIFKIQNPMIINVHMVAMFLPFLETVLKDVSFSVLRHLMSVLCSAKINKLVEVGTQLCPARELSDEKGCAA